MRILTATIDGRPWVANAAVQVAVTSGILAIFGADELGTTLTLALQLDGGPGTQAFGDTPANAMLTIGTGRWVANAGHGGGFISVSVLTERRAAGTFTITASPGDGGREEADARIAIGSFDVTL
jgi:hypothetical protein